MCDINWIRPDISPICANTVPLTQCSQTGYLFLALVALLYNGSVDNQFYISNKTYTSDLYEFRSVIEKSKQIMTNSEERREVNLVENKNYTHKDNALNQRLINEIIDHNDKRNIETNPKRTTSECATNIEEVNEADNFKNDYKEDKEIKTYDFIIVGAGSAGCVIANRLSEGHKWKILLLEAGPEEPEVTSVPSFAPIFSGSSLDWKYRTQPEKLTCRSQKGQTCAWTRGKSMGGSSAINYMVYMRGNKRDYDAWAEMGNHGWNYREAILHICAKFHRDPFTRLGYKH